MQQQLLDNQAFQMTETTDIRMLVGDSNCDILCIEILIQVRYPLPTGS